MYKVLTIAGSDSGGGAGIQADLKTFQERDVYGMSVITALTAQNSLGVHGIYPQSLEAISKQIDAVLSDIGADAIKTGMLFSAEIIQTTALKLKEYNVTNLVIDPVMIAKGGSTLLEKEAVESLKTDLLPLASVITPNIPEASVLLNGMEIQTIEDMEKAAMELTNYGCQGVLVKGGHMNGKDSVDVLYVDQKYYYYESKRIDTKHTHGTGCTFSACIAAELAKGKSISESVSVAKEFITSAIQHSLPLGSGIGPTNHAAYRINQSVDTHSY
ncbi:bifunctional hydroxymethylpyrimidine kinase/phosphomethylpyrimidine kinase [Alkalihalobacillus sp. CinArs1]|uniref:bifunctional hydroxymethylpyrimidine kinase/phosphomethylpyrimidine kinase n=1 Tax=Alkalihalobacillus sp. CinArs1 TaxID=2995314 RepID=UPI0022DD1C76|nr:bifunctional hydroxymethylpyrimidine kinase/phosphomethylpyrimidine kinase [Alkalihalobacillus sp. CinArs1]